MDDLHRAVDALIDGVAEALTAGFGDAAAIHAESRALQVELRGKAISQEALGPKLSTLANALLGEARRRTEARYAAWLEHPRYRREQHLNEAEAADRSLNTALLAVLSKSSPGAMVAFLAAVIRVQAITAVLGEECVYPLKEAGAGRSGKRQRRRTMTAADVPAPVAELVVSAADATDDDARRSALEQLRGLEMSEHNRDAIVTKILVLAGHDDGVMHLNRIADRIHKAAFDQRSDLPSQGSKQGPAPKQVSAPKVAAMSSQGDVRPASAIDVRPPAVRAAPPGPGASRGAALSLSLGLPPASLNYAERMKQRQAAAKGKSQ